MVPAKFEQLVDHHPDVWRQRPRIIAAPGWLLIAMMALCFAPRLDAQDERAELDAVREQIVRLEERMAEQRSAMDSERTALERVERQIADRHRELADVRTQAAAEQARLDELDSAAATARVELSSEREALARQVLLSYMTGREELLKLVLNQESPAALGRMVTYYDYFNHFRSERIESVRGELERLAALLREARESRQRLDALAARQERELADLEAARAQRNEMLASLESRLSDSGEALESLQDDERRLEELVLELGDILAAFPAGSEKPFASLKGQLAWPVPGRIDENYGRLRSGGRVRWNGVLLSAEPGTPVRAVYHGRVAFSDWLPGLGLLMIVDHGDGYLSLYGHNEVLLRESGEWVEPGEVLGQVGSAGGRSGLYFELRHDSDPIDARQWMRGNPAP
jgi:septal ring factor EnvC (AmiA/AmiB activator)